MGKLKDPDVKDKILFCLRNEEHWVWREQDNDTAWLEDKTKITIKGFIQAAIKHIESGRRIYKQKLMKQTNPAKCEYGYILKNFKIKTIKVLFKVVFKEIDGKEMLAIISCKKIK